LPEEEKKCSRVCVQLKLFYDVALHQLVVTVVSAVELPPRDNGQPRNPYCKLYLLPDRRYLDDFARTRRCSRDGLNKFYLLFFVMLVYGLTSEMHTMLCLCMPPPAYIGVGGNMQSGGDVCR